jgi:hypothetical protein
MKPLAERFDGLHRFFPANAIKPHGTHRMDRELTTMASGTHIATSVLEQTIAG